MDFEDSKQEAAFRAEVRQWLQANVPTDEETAGMGDLEQAKYWQKKKYDAGWACLRWPKQFGCREASAIEQVIWDQEESRYFQGMGPFSIGQGMAAPTMMTYATEPQQARYIPKLASGEEIWCQLFSEPAAGSDLAALRTKAEKDGDEWVINGQKIWTSGAHFSDYAILVTRSDPTLPKHKGLTYFFLSMKSPGIDIKPIKQISGESNFNEVYFTDVRIPDSQRLGEVGQGWQVALTTLMNERASIGAGAGLGVSDALSMIKELGLLDDAHVRAKLADWYVQEAGLKYTSFRSLTALSRGAIPGPENSIGKLVGAPKSQDLAAFCIDAMEECGAMSDPRFSHGEAGWQQLYMGIPGLRIAGGTDEIMANIIAERVLGLPQEPRADKGIPFNEVPTGGS